MPTRKTRSKVEAKPEAKADTSNDPNTSGGDESEADPDNSPIAEIVELSVPQLPYIRPNRWVEGKTEGELVDRLRGWTIVARLPDDHDLSIYELQQYDMLLQTLSMTSGPYPNWDGDWRERLAPKPETEE